MNFNKPPQMSSEQIAADEAQIAAIRAKNIEKNNESELNSNFPATGDETSDEGFELMGGDRDKKTVQRQDRLNS